MSQTSARQIASLAATAAARLELELSLGNCFCGVDSDIAGLNPPELPPRPAILNAKPHTPAPVPAPAQMQQDSSGIDFTQRADVAAPPTRQTAAQPRPAPVNTGIVAQFLPLLSGAPDRTAAAEPLCKEVLACQRCPLCQSRRQVVFGEGSLDTDLVFIDEAPGREEDLQGRPFIGGAGGLLTDIIEKGMKRPRSSVFMTTLVRCRPEGNRDARPEELAACAPYLDRLLDLIRPRAIVAVGQKTARILCAEDASIEQLRGVWHEYRGIPVMPVYHTSFLLRQRRVLGEKNRFDRVIWQDIQLVMRKLAGGAQ